MKTGVKNGMTRMLLHAAYLVVLLPLPVFAQSSADKPQPVRFDVVSIHPHPPTANDPSDRRVSPGGRFTAKATTPKALMRIALGTDRISGGPGWIDNEMFDISATTADHAEIKSPEQFQAVILALLEERFGFKFHREQKEGQVYWLEMDKPGKLGPALKPSAPDAVANMSSNGNPARSQFKVSKMSMTDIAAGLTRQAGKRVENHTDLEGNYDFEIQWSPEQTADSQFPTLFTVLKEQLGLKLQPAKGSIETIVIDKIEQPSDN